MLNRQSFGTNDNGAIAAGKAAFSGTNVATMLSAKSALEAYNLSGDAQALPTGVDQGKAVPKAAQNSANKVFWDVLP